MRFEKERDRLPSLDPPAVSREVIRRIVGFRIGERPVDPFYPLPAGLPAGLAAPVTAFGTGPP
jgi:hypothetical protein